MQPFGWCEREPPPFAMYVHRALCVLLVFCFSRLAASSGTDPDRLSLLQVGASIKTGAANYDQASQKAIQPVAGSPTVMMTSPEALAASTQIAATKTSAGWRGMYYMQNAGENGVVVCTCAKCGSTSLFKFVYENTFGHSWEFKDAPYLQEVWSPRWEKSVSVVTDAAAQKAVMNKAYSFALVRDPKERLLSAWSSKVSCDNRTSADNGERAVFVTQLLKVAGKDWSASCLSLQDFLVALNDIHMANNSHLLNDHFRPQTQECFENFAPSQWSKVVSIRDKYAFTELATHLGKDAASAANALPAHTHASAHNYAVNLDTQVLLNMITVKEYAVLGEYLPQPEDMWDLSVKNVECTNAISLGAVSDLWGCKTIALNNTRCSRMMISDGTSCSCVAEGDKCTQLKSEQKNMYWYQQDSFWGIVSNDAYCRHFKDLGYVNSSKECQYKSTINAGCGNTIFTNGKSCACLPPDQVCELQFSDDGYTVYQFTK